MNCACDVACDLFWLFDANFGECFGEAAWDVPEATEREVEALTASELRTARLAADGLTNTEIAQRLFVTTKTVEKHLGNAYTKLEIETRKDLPEALAGSQPTG